MYFTTVKRERMRDRRKLHSLRLCEDSEKAGGAAGLAVGQKADAAAAGAVGALCPAVS